MTSPQLIPGRERCFELLVEAGAPPHIREHSRRVADVALLIARALIERANEPLDLMLLDAGALLHDISKMYTIENGGRHAELGGKYVLGLGCSPEIARIVVCHVDLGSWEPEGRVTEAELVNYADKRVRHTEIVTLNERFKDLFERYGLNEQAKKRLDGFHEEVRALEEKIFNRIDADPDTFLDDLEKGGGEVELVDKQGEI